jgi:hypothetical protein
MSQEDRLRRLGLLHLKDKPDELLKALDERERELLREIEQDKQGSPQLQKIVLRSGTSGGERAGSERMPGMSEEQVEQFIEYLRKRIERLAQEGEEYKSKGNWEWAGILKDERTGWECAEGAFWRILEGRKP